MVSVRLDGEPGATTTTPTRAVDCRATTMDDGRHIATIDAHERGAPAFRIKIVARGDRFVIMPHRDPEQPRWWCVVVAKWAAGGPRDPAAAGVIAQRQLGRDELTERLAAMRTNLDAWLAEPSRQLLTAWLLTGPPAPSWDPKHGGLPLMETMDEDHRAASAA